MTRESRLEGIVAFASGLLFAVGLAVAGMTQPAKVLGFLDVAGDWDPSLAFVMVGAIAVYFVANRIVANRSRPLIGTAFHLPTRRDLDPKLVIGSALFGVGWALAGYCPGPGLTSIATGSLGPIAFVAAMAIGMRTYEAIDARRNR